MKESLLEILRVRSQPSLLLKFCEDNKSNIVILVKPFYWDRISLKFVEFSLCSQEFG